MERIETATAPIAGAAAHTLKGSAQGIGAFALARAASQVEEAAMSGDAAGRAEGVDSLRVAIRDARAEIAGLAQPRLIAQLSSDSLVGRLRCRGRPNFCRAAGSAAANL